MAFEWPKESKGFADWHENTIFIYGTPKIGKSTFASKFPDALFLQTEEGTKHLSTKAWKLKSWETFINALGAIEKNIKDCPFKTIVIDTVDNLAGMADSYICSKYSLNTLGDLDYGKAFSYYTKEFTKQIARLLNIGLGVVFISHSESKEVRVGPFVDENGNIKPETVDLKQWMIIPTVERRACSFIQGLADIILYMETNRQDERVVHAQPSAAFLAGDRSGRLPSVLPLSYQSVVDAYNDNEAKTDIVNRIIKAEIYLAEHKVDGHDSEKRLENSRKKHMGTADIKEANMVSLDEYLRHLKAKTRNYMAAQKKSKAAEKVKEVKDA